ncbi:MAG: TetR/AcrR family transcriptional regulator [Chitinophagales bacterium]
MAKMDISTEGKIKAAAKKLFTKNGFEATRTRDIAEEAGINLALLNYYFRSKQKLFEVVMRENVTLFLGSILETINKNQHLTFDEKIELLIDQYIDMLLANPDLPFFILSISRTEEFKKDDSDNPILQSMKLMRASFMQTILADIQSGKLKPVHPLHIISNLMSMIVFPFAASALLKTRTGISDEEFEKLMLERKKLIPVWIKAMFDN